MAERVTFFGPFGQGNLGNDCTLLAMVQHLRLRRPDVRTTCVCTSADARVRIAGVATVPVRDPFVTPRRLRHGRLGRYVARAVLGIPWEAARWIHGFRALRGTRMLIVPGTQFLSDNLDGPFGWPYLAFAWSVLAKLRGSRLLFVSVGVGPLRHRLSRVFVRCALSLADFRSYRDEPSRDYAARIGVDVTRDPVYPDLAFSLPSSPRRDAPPGRRPVVAVGVKEYRGQYAADRAPVDGDAVYTRFRDTLATVVARLLEDGYTVRLVVGDLAYDPAALADLREALKRRGVDHANDRLIDEPIHSLEQLVGQLAESDIVLSPRFHNVALGLLLERPVIALAYHGKFAALFGGGELARYNLSIDAADADAIVAAVAEAARSSDALRPRIARLAGGHRVALDEQYARIFTTP